MLKGNLSSFSLGEIFQSLAVNNHTGTLNISTRDGSRKCIYFSRGEISLFSSGSPEALRIGEILMRQQKLLPADLTTALDEQKQTGELLGKILVRKGLIEKDDIRQALEVKIREEIYDLFLLTEAEFEFHINHLPEEVFDPLQKNTRIAINTSAVIMEGLRRLDEWKLIQRRIKTFDEIFVQVSPESPGPEEDSHEAVSEVLARLDGRTTVQELFKGFAGSRFECSKVLYELVESGRIRFLAVEEAIVAGHRAQQAADLAGAIRFYRFADQLDPTRVEVLEPMAACLSGLQREEEAAGARRRAIAVYVKRGMHKATLALAGPLLDTPQGGDLDVAEAAFRAALALEDEAAARKAGNRVLSIALEKEDLPRAEDALEKLTELDPQDLNLKVELAEVCSKLGNKPKAITHLESTASQLLAKKKYKELIKVLLLVFEIDPKRQDVKQRIQKLLALQEKMEKRKKRRVGIVGGSLIGSLLLSVFPLFYELKARELYSHAQRLEEISLVSNDFSKVKAAYEQVLHTYSFSSQVGKARLGLDRVTLFERKKLQSLEGEKAAAERMHEEKLQVLREALPDLLKEARRFEESGDFQQAFDIYTRLVNEFDQVPGAKNISFPLLVTSQPRGAQVEVNGVAQGVTPLVLRAQKGLELSLVLTRSGCAPAQEKVQSGQNWRAHFALNRRPLADMKFSGPIQQAMDAAEDRIFFASRDGFLSAAIPGRKELAWQRRVGKHGDLISDLGLAPEEVLLGNVNGELSAISRESGKARWRARLTGAILAAPLLSPDGRWVAAATTAGEVGIFDHSTGEVKGRFLAEDEVTAAPVFLGDILLVGSADRRLYELSVPDASPRGAVELPAGIEAGLTRVEDGVLLATGDGSLHRFSASARSILWSRRLGSTITGPPVADQDRAYLGTAAGDLVAVELGSGAVAWSLKASTSRLGRVALAGGRVYVGTELGELIAVVPGTGVRDWSYKADAAIAAPPLLAFGRLYVPCTSGKILVMELME